MAFPATAAPTATAFSSANTTHNVAMPAVVDSGDLLVIGFTANGNAAVTNPSGWTLLADNTIGATAPVRLTIHAKVADGTEDGTAVNVATGAAEEAVAHVFRVTGWFGAIAGVEAGVLGSATFGTSWDPGNITASWGAADNLFIAMAGATDDDVAFTGYPTNYTGGSFTVSGAGFNSGCEIGSAWRQLNAASDDPSAFTGASTETWLAQGIVIRPAAGASVTAESGSYSVTGNAANTLVAHRLIADAGAYALTGQDAATLIGYHLDAQTGSYTLTGSDAGLLLGDTLTAEAGAYSLTGVAAQTTVGKRVNAEAGNYSLTGTAVATLWNHRLTASPGAYVLTGSDVSFQILTAAQQCFEDTLSLMRDTAVAVSSAMSDAAVETTSVMRDVLETESLMRDRAVETTSKMSDAAVETESKLC
ncbi:hypothetical protein HBA54_04825 [Pelagibius litoralis]|uniref:MBG domain-containing protein n=1 Tax=Pelagibius litoralis TaxID=374515 RepID=A0A967EVJ0_9PROT|nr:hypothetical protein [Pelagibius litoralis]NIA67909.1 hypothetical protein [Pelagibius litoralis]